MKAVDRMKTERIQLDAQEIVDMVEEQLAWLAIASTEKHTFVFEDFRRAESTISLGKNCVGQIDVGGVEAHDQSEWMAQPEAVRIEQNRADWKNGVGVALQVLPHLGERMRYAQLVQCDPKEATEIWCGTADGLTPEDYAYTDAKDLGFSYTEAFGVRYKLRSIGLCTKRDSDFYTRGHPTRGMQSVIFQEVLALADGRSASRPTVLALHPDGRLLHLPTGKPLDSAADAHADLIDMHPWSHYFHEFIAYQFLRRPQWTVELSLTKGRTGVGLNTDADGARAIVNMLGREQTRSGRRSALVHWVKEHYRQRRTGGDPSLVRSHMRGASGVSAGGLWATIWPSRDDIDKASNGKRFEQEQRP